MLQEMSSFFIVLFFLTNSASDSQNIC
jgi:hypothetical protein